jgi:hypothetical protein
MASNRSVRFIHQFVSDRSGRMLFFKSERSDLFGDFTTCHATRARRA